MIAGTAPSVDLQRGELGCNLCKALVTAFPKANLDLQVLTFPPTEFVKPLGECGKPFALC
jgi:hypothetical protein